MTEPSGLFTIGSRKRKMNKNMIKGLVFVFLIIIFSQLALAIGVSPTKQIVDFEPGLSKTMSITILNDQNQEMKAVVYVRGDLANYTSIGNTLIEFKEGESSKTFSYELALPNDIGKPGPHESEIVIMEFPKEFGTGEEKTIIGAVGAVVSELVIRVELLGINNTLLRTLKHHMGIK